MVRYAIRIRGHLDGDWADWFDGFACTNLPNGEAILTGPVADQAALHGLLARLRDLNVTLLAVNPLPEPEGGEPTPV